MYLLRSAHFGAMRQIGLDGGEGVNYILPGAVAPG
jgi:hypothetical protein